MCGLNHGEAKQQAWIGYAGWAKAGSSLEARRCARKSWSVTVRLSGANAIAAAVLPRGSDAITCRSAGRRRDPLHHRVLHLHQDRRHSQAGQVACSAQGAAEVRAP